MHHIGFCQTLDFDSQGIDYQNLNNQRGVRVSKDFSIHRIFPMAATVTPLHILSAPRCLVYKDGRKLSDVLTPDKETLEYISTVLADGGKIIAPDCCLDPDERVDVMFEHREKDLISVVNYLFDNGYENVAIWSNNGIGDTISVDSLSNGVLRDSDGIAYAVRKDGEIYTTHQKGLPNSFQNSAHAHTHLAPDTGYGLELKASLLDCFDKIDECSTQEFREQIRQKDVSLPCIGLCLMNRDDDLRYPLSFEFFHSPNDSLGKGAQFVRNFVCDYSKRHGLDFDDKETKKEAIKQTHEFYSQMP